MKIFKKIAVRIIPSCIMAFIILAAIAYHRGVYDFTFIERPMLDAITTEESTETEPPVTETEPPETTTELITETTAPETTAPLPPEPSEEYVDSLSSAASMTNWWLSDQAFTGSMRIAKLDTAVTLDNNFSLRTREEIQYLRIPNDTYGGYTTVSQAVPEHRPAVEVYMDYIFVDNGSTVTVLDQSGSVLLTGLDTEVYEPAYTRDSNDIPQFKYAAGVNADGSINYIYYHISGGSMVASTYDDAAEGRGLYFNYTKDFGKGDSALDVKYDGTKYGYARENGAMVTRYTYTRAFNYSEGLAAVVKPETVRTDKLMLSYINTAYYDELYCMKGYWNGWYYNDVEQRVAANYRLPDTFGEESIGFFYFENGLCRVRKQEHNYYHTYQTQQSDRLMTDEDLVIRSDGTVYDIPGGYNVVSYSSGIFVLEKDGKYGCMDYTGDFIAAPDYDVCEPFHEGLGVVAKDGHYGVIDTEGNFVVPMVFDYIQSCSSGVIAAYDDACGWILLGKLA